MDDEPTSTLSLTLELRAAGLDNLRLCTDSRDVLPLLETEEVEVILLDLAMPHLSGRELLPLIREQHPDLPVIVVTGLDEVRTAVECMRHGVVDYLVKPVERTRLVATVRRAVELRELERENSALKNRLIVGRMEDPGALPDVVLRDPAMRAVFLYAEAIAKGPRTVLVVGETGSGKDVVARAIHALSGRAGELVCVNIAGLDDTMLSDALFGHVKGAFTGAAETRRGLIVRAAGGTLFLDEIGDLAPQSQVKLLRLLETAEYYALGSDTPRRTDARIIVATSRSLEQEMAEGRFRKDLYYRLRTHQVSLPPLRSRPADLEPLAAHFTHQAALELGIPEPKITTDALELLRRYPFPGNVRELRAMVYDAMTRHPGPLLPASAFETNLAAYTPTRGPVTRGGVGYFSDVDTLPTLREATDELVREALSRCGGNQTAAARLLGVTPQAVSKRVRGSTAAVEPGPRLTAP